MNFGLMKNNFEGKNNFQEKKMVFTTGYESWADETKKLKATFTN